MRHRGQPGCGLAWQHAVQAALQVTVDVLRLLLCMLYTAVEGVDRIFCVCQKVLALNDRHSLQDVAGR